MIHKLKHVLFGLALIGGLAALNGSKTANIGHYVASKISADETVDALLTTAGAGAGGYGGAELGAAIGSAAGPVGAVIGAVVGAM